MTDDFFGMLDDGEGANLRTEKMDVAIGRFPCTTESDAQTLVSKAIAYLNNEAAGPWQNLLYFLADDGDGNLHMEGAKRAMDAISGQADDYVIQPVFWDAYPREVTSTSRSYPQVEELLHTAMADGALVMNYTGHGDPNRVSHENVLTLEDFRTNRTTGLPLWVMASCEVTPYDNGEDNMGRAGILNPAGGGIAFNLRLPHGLRQPQRGTQHGPYARTPGTHGRRTAADHGRSADARKKRTGRVGRGPDLEPHQVRPDGRPRPAARHAERGHRRGQYRRTPPR